MTSPHDFRLPHYAEEMLEDYVFGALSADEAAWLEEHIASCTACQHALVPLMAVVQSLPFATPAPPVPVSGDLWDRIERSIARTDTLTPLQAGGADPSQSNVRPFQSLRLMTRQWLAIAALMLVSLLGGTLLGQVLPQFDDGEEVEGQQIAIQFTDPGITATGELRYLPDEQVFVLDVTGMPELPEGYVYQAWLIEGDDPVPVGVMRAESGEIASAGNRDKFEMFCISVEPGPLGNPAPTSDPILVAPLNDDIAKSWSLPFISDSMEGADLNVVMDVFQGLARRSG
jgi:anti-sigma-K factor RskA